MYRYSSCIFKSDNDNMWYPVLNHVLFMEFWKSAQCKIRKKNRHMVRKSKTHLNYICIDTYSMFFHHGLCDTASSRNMIGKLTNNNVFSVTNYVCCYDYQMPAAFFVAKGSSKMMSGTNLMRYVHHDLYIILYSYPLDYFLSISTFIHSC